jgi:hypothetical protein
MEDKLIEALGYEEAFKALSAALSYDSKEDNYDYILRTYDLNDEAEDEDEAE